MNHALGVVWNNSLLHPRSWIFFFQFFSKNVRILALTLGIWCILNSVYDVRKGYTVFLLFWYVDIQLFHNNYPFSKWTVVTPFLKINWPRTDLLLDLEICCTDLHTYLCGSNVGSEILHFYSNFGYQVIRILNTELHFQNYGFSKSFAFYNQLLDFCKRISGILTGTALNL